LPHLRVMRGGRLSHGTFAAAMTLASLLCVLRSPPAAAQTTNQETQRAKQLFEAGVVDYDAGRYVEALTQFQEAYRIKPHPLVRVNIANCFQKLDRPVEAIENFEAFLGMAEGSPAQRDEVRAALKELRERVGQIALKVAPSGARILIDDRDERRAPVTEPLLASVGRHRVTVSLDGYETALRVVDVRPHETAQLQVELASVPASELEASAAAANTQPEPPAGGDDLAGADEQMATLTVAPPPIPTRAADEATPRRRGLPVSVWIAGGATFGLLVSAVVTGQLALAVSREFDGDLAAVRNPQLSELQRGGAWSRGVDAARRADALAAATDVLLGVALVGAGLTTYFYLSDRADGPSETPRVSASISPGAGRVQLQGRF
jgi:hypothetical protein